MAASNAYTRFVKGRCGKNAKTLEKKYRASAEKNGKSKTDVAATVKAVYGMGCNVAGTKKKRKTTKATGTNTKRKTTTQRKRA